ncbi:hypothetical protein COT75_03500 [Candidatus Beckwithbacteria bacterium CG10_big_fil_rev_8_21_14_0_10_34_10]|uniref:Uncharacterized protein n=1 Tax=Candidatus Beckwithbacteria bacterium CG10_big_fil_rev_8_21_14_0_10_34_10 TaxID=1974495 RepID=A0A2H0WAW0_9BACT|nr:MAG: hypothetical protein COT75_03500 [Candidatus Beckwithbacteria bacterium CG10_big_fil_rev_8_21_14_0_10_34_10]
MDYKSESQLPPVEWDEADLCQLPPRDLEDELGLLLQEQVLSEDYLIPTHRDLITGPDEVLFPRRVEVCLFLDLRTREVVFRSDLAEPGAEPSDFLELRINDLGEILQILDPDSLEVVETGPLSLKDLHGHPVDIKEKEKERGGDPNFKILKN